VELGAIYYTRFQGITIERAPWYFNQWTKFVFEHTVHYNVLHVKIRNGMQVCTTGIVDVA
jgi:hypothetical protein